MIYGLYRAATCVGGPIIRHYLNRRLRAGKEDAARFNERLGHAPIARPTGPVVWLHAASVGESLSLLPLIDFLLDTYPGVTPLVTTGTVTSAALMVERLPQGAIHQFVPVDRVVYVRRFLDHWKPDLALWAESEFWPNMVVETAKRGTPMILINGRISDKSYATWQRYPGFIRHLLGAFSLCLGQTDDDVSRLQALGATRAECHGNIKFSVPPLPVVEDALRTLSAAIGSRPVWLAASTHDGEEILAARVHKALQAAHPDLLTLIVPRHPGRGEAIATDIAAQGLTVARRTKGEPLAADTDVYIADTMGEMGLFYRLSPIVFIGKTLTAQGGQNPIEPAKLDCALLHGPHMTNFAHITRQFQGAKAAVAVADEAGLRDAIDHLLRTPDEQVRLAKAAQDLAASQADALTRVMAALAPFLKSATEASHAAS